MATINVWALGGLDQKSNDLNRSTEKASEMQNVEYDTQSTIKKRTGYDLYLSYPHDDMVYFQQTNEILLFNSSILNPLNCSISGTTLTTPINSQIKVGMYIVGSGITNETKIISGSGTSWVIDNSYSLPSVSLNFNSKTVRVVNVSTNTYRDLKIPFPIGTADISYTENQQNLYFTSTDLSIPVMKYDGSNIYRAGLPAPRTTSTTTESAPIGISPTTGYTRLFYGFKDLTGNLIFSPYHQYSNAYSSFTVGTLKTDSTFLLNGFYDKYCYFTTTTYLSTYATINSTSRTLTVSKHNYISGDKFLFDTENKSITISSSKSFIVLDVESVTGTTITFTSTSIGSNSITITNIAVSGTSIPIDIRSRLYMGTSSSSDFGYTVSYPYVIDNSISNQTISVINPEIWFVGTTRGEDESAFEDIYDSTTLKILPPYCKYIGSYGNQIIYGNVGLFFNDDNTSVNYDNGDLIVFSDLSSGDGPENVSPLNFQKIGETYEADITGLKRCNDLFVVCKRNGVFAIDGALFPSQYQLRKISTNYVGCTSHKSLMETEEGIYFQAHNGLYFTNGIVVKKVSYELDSYFGSGKFEKTRSVRFKAKQKALFYISGTGFSNSKIVVVDYYYQQVYFWTNIDATNGFIEDVNGNVYFSSGSSIFKFDNAIYNDNGTAIDAYYSTTYHHCGAPSLRKKFLSLRVFALTNDAFTLTVTHDKDWAGDNTQNPHTLTFGSTDQTQQLVHDMQTCRAQRYTFRNNVLNEPMVLTGYDIHWEPQQQNDKN